MTAPIPVSTIRRQMDLSPAAHVANFLSEDVIRALTHLLTLVATDSPTIDPLSYELARNNLHHTVNQFVTAANTSTFKQRTAQQTK